LHNRLVELKALGQVYMFVIKLLGKEFALEKTKTESVMKYRR